MNDGHRIEVAPDAISERQRRWQESARGNEEFLATRPEPERAEVSGPLRWAAVYFEAMGTLRLLVLGLGALLAIRHEPLRELYLRPLNLIASAAIGVAMLYTGSQLRKRSRSAAISAAAAFVLPAISTVASGIVSLGGLLSGAIGLGFLAYVWKELE